MSSPEKLLGGRYRVLRQLGRGGFGRTYLVEDTRLPNNVRRVVKQLVLSPDIRMSKKEAWDMFRREVKCLAELGERSLQLATLHDCFEQGGQLYYIQEYIEGPSLADELGRGKRKSESEVIELLTEILEGLKVIHDHAYIHLDLKPENLVRNQNNANKLAIIDFGAMRSVKSMIAGQESISVRRVIATEGYIAPEYEKNQPKFASDVYSVGMIGLFALTGINPHPSIEGFKKKKDRIDWQRHVRVSSALAKALDNMTHPKWWKRTRSSKEALRALLAIQNNRRYKSKKIALATIFATIPIMVIVGFSSFRKGFPAFQLRPISNNSSRMELSREVVLAANWRIEGDKAHRSGQYESAIGHYDRALALAPIDSVTWFHRGLSLAKLGQNNKALASFDRAIEIKPDSHEVWGNRGLSLASLGQKDKALASFDKAIEIKPDFQEAWANRGLVYASSGQHNEALVSFNKAIEIKPAYHEVWYNRGISLVHLGQYEEALASFDETIKIRPDFYEAEFNQAALLANLSRHEEALVIFAQIIEAKPDSHEAWIGQGNSLDDLGRYEEALDSFDEAIKIAPNSHGAWNNRGMALINLNREKDALYSFTKAIELQPDSAIYRQNRDLTAEKLSLK